MIATRDIGKMAAQALAHLDFRGHSSRELHGMRDVTYQEVARLVGAAIGKPDLAYRQVPAMFLKPALVGMGMSANMVDLLLQMSDAMNSGYMRKLSKRAPRKPPAQPHGRSLRHRSLRPSLPRPVGVR